MDIEPLEPVPARAFLNLGSRHGRRALFGLLFVIGVFVVVPVVAMLLASR
jgi:hypothetical protein